MSVSSALLWRSFWVRRPCDFCLPVFHRVSSLSFLHFVLVGSHGNLSHDSLDLTLPRQKTFRNHFSPSPTQLSHDQSAPCPCSPSSPSPPLPLAPPIPVLVISNSPSSPLLSFTIPSFLCLLFFSFLVIPHPRLTLASTCFFSSLFFALPLFALFLLAPLLPYAFAFPSSSLFRFHPFSSVLSSFSPLLPFILFHLSAIHPFSSVFHARFPSFVFFFSLLSVFLSKFTQFSFTLSTFPFFCTTFHQVYIFHFFQTSSFFLSTFLLDRILSRER